MYYNSCCATADQMINQFPSTSPIKKCVTFFHYVGKEKQSENKMYILRSLDIFASPQQDLSR